MMWLLMYLQQQPKGQTNHTPSKWAFSQCNICQVQCCIIQPSCPPIGTSAGTRRSLVSLESLSVRQLWQLCPSGSARSAPGSSGVWDSAAGLFIKTHKLTTWQAPAATRGSLAHLFSFPCIFISLSFPIFSLAYIACSASHSNQISILSIFPPPHHYYSSCQSQKMCFTDSQSHWECVQCWCSLLCVLLFRRYPSILSGEQHKKCCTFSLRFALHNCFPSCLHLQLGFFLLGIQSSV